jgi:hypothetical protein
MHLPVAKDGNVPFARWVVRQKGSAATHEDWFVPTRLEPDYVPTGFRGFDGKTRSIPGHPFGLALTPSDRGNLIAFLKTL